MKTQEDDLLVYDEDDAVKFILNFLPEDAKKSINDSKIEYVLDVVYVLLNVNLMQSSLQEIFQKEAIW